MSTLQDVRCYIPIGQNTDAEELRLIERAGRSWNTRAEAIIGEGEIATHIELGWATGTPAFADRLERDFERDGLPLVRREENTKGRRVPPSDEERIEPQGGRT